jgi:hypothetical protein
MEARRMSESIRLFVASEGHDSNTVDAAPGIEPPPATSPQSLSADPAPAPENKLPWFLIAYLGHSELKHWSMDRGLLERYALLRGYKAFTIEQPRQDKQLPAEWMTVTRSPRHLSIENLPLSAYGVSRFMDVGVHTLGDMAAMSLERFRYHRFKPQDYHPIQRGLLAFGMKMSFDLLPGEQRGWSPRRKYA